jgi:hypothetical protein
LIDETLQKIRYRGCRLRVRNRVLAATSVGQSEFDGVIRLHAAEVSSVDRVPRGRSALLLDVPSFRHYVNLCNEVGALLCRRAGITMNDSASGPSQPGGAWHGPDTLRYLTSGTSDERSRLEAASVPSLGQPLPSPATHPITAYLPRSSLRCRFAVSRRPWPLAESPTRPAWPWCIHPHTSRNQTYA